MLKKKYNLKKQFILKYNYRQVFIFKIVVKSLSKNFLLKPLYRLSQST